MDSFSLRLQEKITLFMLLIFFQGAASAATLEGLDIPDQKQCAGQTLPLHGIGLRTASWFNIKVYVLAVYAQNGKLDSPPLCFDIFYLKDFDNNDVDRAWDYQFSTSNEHKYDKLEDDIKFVKATFGPITGKRHEGFELSDETTKIFENETLKGEIKGKDFQKSFLSLWFGENPPTKQLKEDILRGRKK